MIFDRDNGDMEVWRSISTPEHDVVESSAPDASQLEVYGFPDLIMGDLFQPWAVLHMPQRTSANFRFVYPTLVVAAYDRAYLWDIPSGKLIEEYQPSEVGNNHYFHRIVEISERHVFIAAQFHMRVFSRATRKSVLNFSSTHPREYGLWKYMPGPTISHDPTPDSGSALVRYEIDSTQDPYTLRSGISRFTNDEFVAGMSPSLCWASLLS
jgi:hypothetical protein